VRSQGSFTAVWTSYSASPVLRLLGQVIIGWRRLGSLVMSAIGLAASTNCRIGPLPSILAPKPDKVMLDIFAFRLA
jgi:hypothetical protein